MKMGDVSCPDYNAGFRRIELSPRRDAEEVAYRLTVVPTKPRMSPCAVAGHQSKQEPSPVIFGEFLVDPASAVVAPPDLAQQQLPCDRPSRNKDGPQVPDLGPTGLRIQSQHSK